MEYHTEMAFDQFAKVYCWLPISHNDLGQLYAVVVTDIMGACSDTRYGNNVHYIILLHGFHLASNLLRSKASC